MGRRGLTRLRHHSYCTGTLNVATPVSARSPPETSGTRGQTAAVPPLPRSGAAAFATGGAGTDARPPIADPPGRMVETAESPRCHAAVDRGNRGCRIVRPLRSDDRPV